MKKHHKKIKILLLLTAPLTLIFATVAVFGAAGPSEGFFKMSWDKMAKTETYKADCTVTVPFFKKHLGLDAATSQNVGLLELAYRDFSRHEVQSIRANDPVAFASGEKVDTISPLDAYFSTEKYTYEEVLDLIKLPQKKTYQFAVTPIDFYFMIGLGQWKIAADPNVSASILNNIREARLTDPANFDSFEFKRWKKERKNKFAIYEGMSTSEQSASLLKKATQSTVEGDLAPSGMTLWLDSNGMWTQSESVFKLQGTNAEFNIKESCKFTYAPRVKIELPKNAKTVEAQAGLTEFMGFIQAF